MPIQAVGVLMSLMPSAKISSAVFAMMFAMITFFANPCKKRTAPSLNSGRVT